VIAARAGRGFLLPGLLFLFVIDVVPLLYSAWISLYDWWLVRPRNIRFVGLDNYLRLAADAEAWRAVVVTCFFTFGAVTVEFLAGLALALLFAQPFRFLRPFRVLLLLPLFVVPVVGGTMWRVIFHPDVGVLNHYLGVLGLGQPQWLSHPHLALLSIVMVDAWRTIPFMFLVIYAGLEVLPGELYEAAAVDGASSWQSFRHVTVPLLAYIMLVAVLIRTMDAFREFDIIFVLTGGGPGTATQTIQMLNYREFGLGHMGSANAIGVVTLALVAVMCYGLLRATTRSAGVGAPAAAPAGRREAGA
jgi:multiple sugar transport system permease protein